MANPTETEADDTPESLFLTLSGWVKEDRRRLSPWYKEARLDYRMKAGGDGQWEPDDIKKLDEQQRPHTSFNFIGPSVNSVAGMEVSNRQEVTYLPRTTQSGGRGDVAMGQPGMGQGMQPGAQPPIPGADDTGPSELFTGAGKYFRDQCDAEDEESDAFQDDATCGVGCTETRIDYDDDPQGRMLIDRCDPLEMGWDHRASKRNMVDARRIHRVREMDKRAALAMFDGYDLEEIDAAWARPSTIEDDEHSADKRDAYNQGTQDSQERGTVHVVEITWFDMETSYQIANPGTGETKDISNAKELKKVRERAKKTGIKLNVATRKRKAYKQAFLGSEGILGDEQDGTPCQSQTGFKFNFVTGMRDRNAKQWVGIVRAMRDPQRWANALYSSVLNTIMTSGKGVMAERSAFEKPDEAEANWANSGKITFLKEGALSGQNPKIVQKVPSNLPPAIIEMMQFATNAMPMVSGVNLETLGSQDESQAASLDRQRKQSAITQLAPFFDGLRRYRKEQGRLMLDLIKNYLSDSRLVRIVGPDYEKYVPLIHDDSVSEFDIIVAESPSSPNQKEASWETIKELLPVVGKNMGPNSTIALLKASPLTESSVDDFKEATEKDAQAAAAQPNPEMLKIQGDIQAKQMDAQNADKQAQQQMAITQQKAQSDQMLAQQKGETDKLLAMMNVELKKLEIQLAQFQAQAELQQMQIQIELEHVKAKALKEQTEMNMTGAREKHTLDMETAKFKAKQARQPAEAR